MKIGNCLLTSCCQLYKVIILCMSMLCLQLVPLPPSGQKKSIHAALTPALTKLQLVSVMVTPVSFPSPFCPRLPHRQNLCSTLYVSVVLFFKLVMPHLSTRRPQCVFLFSNTCPSSANQSAASLAAPSHLVSPSYIYS